MALRNFVSPFQARGNVRQTQPATEPVTPAELRVFIREDIETLPDDMAQLYIMQAREFIEEHTGLALITQTWLMTLDKWPGYTTPWWDGVREMAISELNNNTANPVIFPRYPLQSVDSVTVYNEADDATTVVVADVFVVDTQQKPGRMQLKRGQIWPLNERVLNSIEIEYTAGFGPIATDVPALIRGAVLDLAGYYYTHRNECDLERAAQKSGALSKISMFASRGL